jgi:hypothetical protein
MWVKVVEDMPVGVRRSVDVKHRIRKRPVEGKSSFISYCSIQATEWTS